MTVAEGRRFSPRAVEIRARGREAVEPLPSLEQVKAAPEEERRRLLEPLRVELYAIASIVADDAVRRGRDERSEYPPYGLAKSMHSVSRMILAHPEPFAEGEITGFLELGKAYMDTLVFHLDREFKEEHGSPSAWMHHRLEELLALFRVGAGPAAKARMRNGFSFMYGGLHFGVSVCTQLTEVMCRMLDDVGDVSRTEKARVVARSSRPAYRLAALNLDHVIPAYQALQAGGWMDAGRFTLERSDGRPWRIDLSDEEVARLQGLSLSLTRATWPTQGCPARNSSTPGERSAIATLWLWGVELAQQAELL